MTVYTSPWSSSLIFYRYAEMPSEIKNSISHRGKALKALKEYFESTMTANENQSDEPVNKKPKNSTEQTWAASILILHGCIIGQLMYIVYLNIFCFCWIKLLFIVFHSFVLHLFITYMYACYYHMYGIKISGKTEPSGRYHIMHYDLENSPKKARALIG